MTANTGQYVDPHGFTFKGANAVLREGPAVHQLVGEVTAHQGDDAYLC